MSMGAVDSNDCPSTDTFSPSIRPVHGVTVTVAPEPPVWVHPLSSAELDLAGPPAMKSVTATRPIATAPTSCSHRPLRNASDCTGALQKNLARRPPDRSADPAILPY